MEAALDSYLSSRNTPKRQRTCKEPPAQQSAPAKAANLEEGPSSAHDHLSKGSVGNLQCGAIRKSSSTRIIGGDAAYHETPTSGVLMIEVADDSDDEFPPATGEARISDRHALAVPSSEICRQRAIVQQPPPPLSQLPNNFSFSLGECVANGTVTSGTISRLSLTDPLALMVEVRMPLAQRAGSQQSFRKAKLSNSGYRIVYVRLDDPLLHEHQKWLGQPELRKKCQRGNLLPGVVPPTTLFKRESASGSRGGSSLAGINFQELMSSISEQTTFLRLLIDGREAARLDRQVSSSLSTLLLLGAIKPVGGKSSLQRHEGVSLGAGTNEDVKLRQRLEALKGSTSAGAFGPLDDETEEEPEGHALTGAVGLQKISEESGLSGSLEDEDDDAKSTALCDLLFGEATAAKDPRELQSYRRLGSVYPPESVFVSRLRPYQAQGLWWMLQCESGQSVFVKDEYEAVDPLWKLYRLPVSSSEAVEGTKKNSALFVPSYFYVNVTAGLVSISKPHLSGRVRGGILADCMGLGKTVQVLALIAVSALREKDPHSEAAGVEKQARSVAPEDAEPSDDPVEPALSIETDILVLSPSASQASVVPPSPVSVNSDVEPATMHSALSVKPFHASDADEPARKPQRSKIFAPKSHVLQRSLRRDKDNLLLGGTLIVVPLSLISQWQAEVERHLRRGVATVIQYYGSSRCREAELLAAHTIVLTTYQTLASDFRSLTKLTAAGVEDSLVLPELAFSSTLDGVDTPLASIRFRRVVLDEGHTIKNTSSLVNRACNALKADARWVIQCIRAALKSHGSAQDLDAFKLWFDTLFGPSGMVRAAVETVRSVLAPLMLRRQGSDTGEDGKPLLPLPPIKIHTFRLQLTYEERLFYQPAPGAAGPFCSKLADEAMKGALRECPICFEVPREAVVLTSCWHTLCMTCILLLQSSCQGAAAACPTCREKFLPQHVRRVPASQAPSGELWRQVVLTKHRAVLVAARSTECSESKRELCSSNRSARREEAPETITDPAGPRDCRSAMASPQRLVQWEPLENTDEAEFFFSTKMRMLLALLEADVTAGRSCVIFSQWTSMLDLLENAFKLAEESCYSSFGDADPTVELNDEVEEIGSTAARNLPQEMRVSTLVGHGKVLEQDSCNPSNVIQKAQQAQPVHRLYHYRRIDGTLNLEARQRNIRWFTEPKAGAAASEESASLKSSDDHDGPFMGRCGLKPFSGIRTRQPVPLKEGQVSPRLQRCRHFPTSRPLGKILLLSLKTGNVGLNLIKATRCYLVDGWWNPQVEMQAMRRIWRYGQDKPVSVYRFICVRTVEERMEELLEWKERLSRNTLRRADALEQCGVAAAGGDEDAKKRGRLSLQDLKKLFEGWEADQENP
ncbi:hypothetical protein Emag_001284 [Eimeria magna]